MEIRPSTPVWLVGSCFSDNIGRLMSRDGFNVEVNPLGTLYNPESIRRSLSELCGGRVCAPGDLVFNEGRWHSLMHHSRFSADTPETVADAINTVNVRLRAALPSLGMLIVTLGSSVGFYDVESGQVVANCHKLPASRFEQREQSVGQVTGALGDIIGLLRAHAPSLRVMLTVSPIRHKGYGMVRDRLSKSRLLLAVDEIVHKYQGVSYFPAYEIMMDDLRDYRFYAADMIHPSEAAVAYIYEQFAATCFTAATRDAALVARAAALRAAHRQIQPY